MAIVKIIGKKGSKSKLQISKESGLGLFKSGRADAIVNYGLAGKRLDDFLNRHSSTRRIPIINRFIGRAKHLAIQDANDAGLLTPETRLSLRRSDRLTDWIEKRQHSSQGLGIRRARGRGKILNKYYQRMITDRRFELRVHAFMWIPMDEWKLNKRLGPADQIAWNFHQGGHFQSVRYPHKYKVFQDAREIAKKVLEIRHMAFGAVDLIVDNDMQVWFIEVNASPGFSELNAATYCEAMKKLKGLSTKELKKLGR